MISVQEQRDRRGAGSERIRVLGAIWGVAGIAAVLVYAALSLGKHAIYAVSTGLSPLEWLLLVANCIFMAWAEGYRGFQLRFSPRVAARALHVHEHPTLPRLLLAPLFCTGYFGATARLKNTVWIGTGLIVAAVLLFNQMPQPWRGILDAGVMVGLSWGTVSLLVAAWATWRRRQALVAAEVPAMAGL
ncbi:MAG: hypothetical protein Q8N51_04310 [Gammaproteobacteria bacterium]|nr:hypothetical protein [Gammaproteobacteria bacterium]